MGYYGIVNVSIHIYYIFIVHQVNIVLMFAAPKHQSRRRETRCISDS